MKKYGFTLAEVLITLGIIGVVAALTAPALVMSSRNQANAAKLSVAVSNLENAFTNAIAQEGADNLYGTRMWANGGVNAGSGNVNGRDIDIKASFVGELGRYLVISGFKDSDAKYYGTIPTCEMSASGGTDNTACNNSNNSQRFGGTGQTFPILTKQGAVIFIRTYDNRNAIVAGREAAIAIGSSYYTNAADVIIDVNGTSAPNTYGRDIFWFQVGENGILYPYGGRDVARFEGGVWDEAGNRDTCLDGAISGGLGCTARVIEEGYQMNY